MIRWLVAAAGSSIWSMVVFALGMAFFFPTEWVKDQVAYQVQSQSKKKMLIHIGDVNSSGLFGVSLKEVSLYDSKRGRRTPGREGEAPRQNTLIGTVGSISVSPDLMGLMGGTLGADVSVELAGGDLDGSFGINNSQLEMSTDIDGFDLSLHPISMDETELDLAGRLSLISDFQIDQEDVKNSSGGLTLTVDDLSLRQGRVSGFELSATTFSEAVLEMEIDDGKAKVKKGKFTGDLIDATIDGHITLRKDLSRSRLSLDIEVRFDDTLDKIAKMMLKSSRDDDGVYHFKGQGTLMNPRFRPDRVKRGGSSSFSSGAADDGFDGEDASDAEVTPRRRSGATTEKDREKRRAQRRERLKKRRERMKKRREERRAQQAASTTREDDARDEVEELEQDDEPFAPPPQRALGSYDDDRGQGYQEANDFNNNEFGNANDDYQGGDFQGEEDYNDANEEDANLEDIGYLDE